MYPMRYTILGSIYSILYPIYLMHGFGQQGLMPALDSDMAEVFTGSVLSVKA